MYAMYGYNDNVTLRLMLVVTAVARIKLLICYCGTIDNMVDIGGIGCIVNTATSVGACGSGTIGGTGGMIQVLLVLLLVLWHL